MRKKKQPRQPMRVITLAATKGGVGKTTIASALAVRAAKESKRVALIDLDPQESLIAWWERRGKPGNPQIQEMEATIEGVELLLSKGWEWVFIDTSPAKLELIEPGIACADLVLVPCRPSALDVEQAGIPLELCERHGKRSAFVLNHAPAGWKLTRSTIALLKEAGTVLNTTITFREAYMAAMTVGKSGPEVDRKGAAISEIDALWEEVKALAHEKVG